MKDTKKMKETKKEGGGGSGIMKDTKKEGGGGSGIMKEIVDGKEKNIGGRGSKRAKIRRNSPRLVGITAGPAQENTDKSLCHQ